MEADKLTMVQAAYAKATSEAIVAKGKTINKELVIKTDGQSVLYFVRHNGEVTQWGQFRNAIRDYNSRS